MNYLAFPEINGVIFKHIPGFVGYAVTNTGTIWSCRVPGNGYGKFKGWFQIKPCPNMNGRLMISLSKNKRPHRKQVHRLVMLAFVGPAPQGEIVRHWDGNHLNNNLSNLLYGTYKQNEEDKERHGRRLRGDRHPIAKLSIKDVKKIKKLLSLPIKHGTIAKLARQFRIDEAVISRIRDNKAWNWVTI